MSKKPKTCYTPIVPIKKKRLQSIDMQAFIFLKVAEDTELSNQFEADLIAVAELGIHIQATENE